jgi:RNA polymerase sigma-70 factor (ECF subfamily)
LPDESDDQLLELARSGDREALERLLERHQAKVYRFGMKMCRNREDAEDVLQESLLTMARGVRDFRGASSISTWLFTIARSYCIKKRRKSRFAPAEVHSLDGEPGREAARVADPARSAEEVLAGRQVDDALERAIGALDPKYREVLVLRDIEGLSAPEVAEVLGIREQAVKSRLHRARLAVRVDVVEQLGLRSEAPAAPEACPDVVTLFSKHLENEINAETCAEMERHLARCPRCRGACDSLKRTLSLCRTSSSSDEVPQAVRHSVKVALHDFLSGKD